MINDAMFTSNTAEWATPQAFFDKLNQEFGFTLDPCATAENAKCARFFTKEQDGLAQSWQGERVYCNPPYGRDIRKWVEKAHRETLAGGGHTRGYAFTRTHRYVVLPRLHILQARNSVYPRAAALQRKQGWGTVPVNGRRVSIRGGRHE